MVDAHYEIPERRQPCPTVGSQQGLQLLVVSASSMAETLC